MITSDMIFVTSMIANMGTITSMINDYVSAVSNMIASDVAVKNMVADDFIVLFFRCVDYRHLINETVIMAESK